MMLRLTANAKSNPFFYRMLQKFFYLADGIYHVISRHSSLHIKNDSRTAGLSVQLLSCNSCINRFTCTSTLSFNQGDVVFTPDMNFCETKPQPFVSSIQLARSLDQVFRHVTQASSRTHVYSIAEAHQSVLNSVRMGLAELPNVQHISQESLDELTRHNAQYYSSISFPTSTALSS